MDARGAAAEVEISTYVPEVLVAEVEAAIKGDKAEATTKIANEDHTNGDEVKGVTNGDGEEVTEGEAAKRKADTFNNAEVESAKKFNEQKEVQLMDY